MKKKIMASMSVLVFLATLSGPIASATVTEPIANAAVAYANVNLPDLICYWVLIDEAKLKTGRFEIRIKNQGTAAAGQTYVILKVYHVSSKGAKPVEKSYHATVPPIAAGQSADVVIETRMDVSLDTTCGIADGTFKVKESNENNNRICGPADS